MTTPMEAAAIPSDQVGRFQLGIYHTTSRSVLMLDTATGRLWTSTDGGWSELFSPAGAPVNPDE